MKLKMVKRLLAASLAVCGMITLFSACKPDGGDEDSTTQQGITVNSSIAPVTESSTGGSGGERSTAAPNNDPEPTSEKEKPTQKQTVRVTLQEGWSFMQVAGALEKAGVCTAADFYNTCENYTVKSFNIPSSPNRCFKMEGYLFPDTYDFYAGDDPEDVLRKILNNYAAKSGMPSDDTLILASIIERETRSTSHMEKVSSVFHNRLNKGMKLEADCTREYVNNFITGNSLVANQSKYAALYNTYKCAALPSGPICNPSKRAIQAAQNPASTDYLYYFFGQDNDNHYSKTFDEHKELIAQYGVG